MLFRKLNGNIPLGDTGISGKIILKSTSKKYVGCEGLDWIAQDRIQ
jgi:hypothetical protein